MDDKVHCTLVGAFVLLLGAAPVAGVLWLAAAAGGQRHYDTYQSIVRESVAGLSIDAPVKYLGVDVGKVSEIVIDPANDSAYIVYVQRAHEIEHFALNQWVDTPSHMLAPLIVRAIERSGGFEAVLRAPTAATGRLRLDTELVRLQQDFSVAPSQVRLTLRAVLVDVATRSVVGRREFDTRVATISDDPYGRVSAAQAATQQVLTELAAFCAAAANPPAPALPAKP